MKIMPIHQGIFHEFKESYFWPGFEKENAQLIHICHCVGLFHYYSANSVAVCIERSSKSLWGSAFMGRRFRIPQLRPASVVSGSIGLVVLSGNALGQRIVVFPPLHSS